MHKKYLFILYILVAQLFFFNSESAFSLPNNMSVVGDSVFVDNVDSTHFYAVFLPFDYPTKGEVCASMTGEELAQDNDLRHYGTCFVNDPGVFTIVELLEPLHSCYEDTKQSDYFVGETTVKIVSSAAEITPTSNTPDSEVVGQ